MKRWGREVPTDPQVLQNILVSEDAAPAESEKLAAFLAALVEALPEPQRACFEMVYFSNHSYRESARMLSRTLGREVDPKTVWRWANEGRRMAARRAKGSALLRTLMEEYDGKQT